VKRIIVFLSILLALAMALVSCAQLTQESAPPSIPIIDSDGDGMSDWFEENIAHLDPLTPNDRYAVIVNTITIHPNPYFTKLNQKDTTNLKTFLIEEERFKSENIFLFMDKEATYDNFKKTIDNLAKISDENDLVYIMLMGHGTENAFVFHSGKDPAEFELSPKEGPTPIILNNGKETPDETTIEGLKIESAASGKGIRFNEINELIDKINYQKMLFTVECCGAGKLVHKLSRENMVILGRVGVVEVAQKLILGIVSPDAITKDLKWVAQETTHQANALPDNDQDGNSYPSVAELFLACLNDPGTQESIERLGPEHEIISKMIDLQGIATDFYFGEAKIGQDKETDLYLLPPD